MSRRILPILIFFGLCSCATLPNERVQGSLTDTSQLWEKAPSFSEFLKLGPMHYTTVESYVIRVAPDTIMNTDLFLTNSETPSPLVIIQHGNKADRRVHRLQAEHLASWGFHVITVEQPNTRQWIANGHRLAEMIRLLIRWPKLFPGSFQRENIILAGHSFGGSAAAIAGSQAPVSGVIFLDPALYNDDVKSFLRKLHKPTMLLAADADVFYSRKRHKFFNLVPGGTKTVSLRNSTHEDAQFPSLTEVKFFIDPFTDDKNQHYFMGALTASAFSIAKQGNFEFAWEIMKVHQSREKGTFFGFKERLPRKINRRG